VPPGRSGGEPRDTVLVDPAGGLLARQICARCRLDIVDLIVKPPPIVSERTVCAGGAALARAHDAIAKTLHVSSCRPPREKDAVSPARTTTRACSELAIHGLRQLCNARVTLESQVRRKAPGPSVAEEQVTRWTSVVPAPKRHAQLRNARQSSPRGCTLTREPGSPERPGPRAGSPLAALVASFTSMSPGTVTGADDSQDTQRPT
jgi:hypothetical protein